jgi:hypothetical protein
MGIFGKGKKEEVPVAAAINLDEHYEKLKKQKQVFLSKWEKGGQPSD